MISFKVRYVNGNLIPLERDRASLERLLSSYKNKEVKIQIQGLKRSITDSQKSLYIAIVLNVVEQTGNTFNEIEEELFRKFLPHEIKDGLKGFYKKRKVLSDLSTIEFNTFIHQSIIFLNEFFNLNINIDKINE